MRTIERTNQLKRDYKRELKGQHRATLEEDFRQVVMLLVNDQPLPERYRDHALTGNWRKFRDCHVKPDLVLVFKSLTTNGWCWRDWARIANLVCRSQMLAQLWR